MCINYTLLVYIITQKIKYRCLGEIVSSFLKRKLQVTVQAFARDFSPDQGYKTSGPFSPITKCFKYSIQN